MADTIFEPRKLHPGDIVRTEDRKRFRRVFGLDKNFIYLDEEGTPSNYYFCIYPIKLQDTRAIKALGAKFENIFVPELRRSRRSYSFCRGNFVATLTEIDMGYFRAKIMNRIEYEVDVSTKVLYYFHEFQQYFFERTNEELKLDVPIQLDFELEQCYYFNGEGVATYV